MTPSIPPHLRYDYEPEEDDHPNPVIEGEDQLQPEENIHPYPVLEGDGLLAEEYGQQFINIDIPSQPDKEEKEDKDQDQTPLHLQRLRQDLLQAIHRKDANALSGLLTSVSPEDAASAIDEPGEETGFTYGYRSTVTPLSAAIWDGEEELVRIIVQYSTPRTFSAAIAFERVEILKLHFQTLPDSLWYFPESKDPTTVALRALLHTRANGESLFALLHAHSFDLTDAQHCDAGRTIWFWAARNNFVRVLQAYVEAGFPVDLPATATGFESTFPSYDEQEVDVALPGTTALWNAAWKGADQAVEMLLRRGAVPATKGVGTVKQFANGNRGYGFGKGYGSTMPESRDAAIKYLRGLSDRNGDSEQARRNAGYQPDTAVSDMASDEAEDQSGLDELLAASQGLAFATQLHQRATPAGPKPDPVKYASVVHSLLEHGANANTTPTGQPWSLFGNEVDVPILPAVHQFAALGVVPAVQYLFHYGADIYATCSRGRTLLHHAVDSQSVEMLVLVLSRNVPLSCKDSFGHSPIHDCVLHGTLKTLRLLIEWGANVNDLTNVGVSPLLMAVSIRDLQMARALLENGADPNHSFEPGPTFEVTTDFGDRRMTESFCAGTPLLAAFPLYQVSLGMFDLLLKHGASTAVPGCIASRKEEQNGRRFSQSSETSWSWYLEWHYPCQYAAKAVASSRIIAEKLTVEALLTLLRVSQKNYPNWQIPKPVLDDCLRELCVPHLPPDWPERDSGTLWEMPSQAVSALLVLGGNPNVRGSNGVTPLHLSCCRDAPGVEEMIRRLVFLGADVNARDDLGRTPLHYAAVHATSIVETLLKLGADISVYDNDRRDALVYACGNKYSFRPESVAALLAHICNSDIEWKPVLFAACRNLGPDPSRWEKGNIRVDLLGQIITKAQHSEKEILCKYDNSGDTAVHVACKQSSQGPIQAICKGKRIWQVFRMQDRLGRTPLILAALSYYTEKVQVVLRGIRSSVDDNSIDSVRTTSHGSFPSEGEEYMPERLQYTQCPHDPRLNVLYAELQAAALPDDSEDEHPSSSAVCTRERPAPREARAQCLNMRDAYGWTALHYAASSGRRETVRLLLAEPGLDAGRAKSEGGTYADGAGGEERRRGMYEADWGRDPGAEGVGQSGG
ncbi:hypothetical protein H2199_009005 [Coniosporium tulheliwenetii]|uniref:Uncharacterized protein n=1 Tax=Coniosporium tulheliwenetii TaxID=3383036 RepID=A0ACC2YH43_9PEZI|nr:hypothetical protein H2199_009005 [Cladosporium sp. JES 115]